MKATLAVARDASKLLAIADVGASARRGAETRLYHTTLGAICGPRDPRPLWQRAFDAEGRPYTAPARTA